jgi:sec-independent protein translocase protein TatA
MSPLNALAFFGTIGAPELIIVLIILVLLFGATKLPQLGGAIGKTIKGFKREMREGSSDDGKSDAATGLCPKCGAASADDSPFCAKCGATLK